MAVYKSTLLFVWLLISVAALRAQQWTPPTAEELSMTSVPQLPGAPAIYYREGNCDDVTGIWTYCFASSDVINGRVICFPAEYPELRTFFNKAEAGDQEPLVLTRAPAAATSAAN